MDKIEKLHFLNIPEKKSLVIRSGDQADKTMFLNLEIKQPTNTGFTIKWCAITPSYLNYQVSISRWHNCGRKKCCYDIPIPCRIYYYWCHSHLQRNKVQKFERQGSRTKLWCVSWEEFHIAVPGSYAHSSITYSVCILNYEAVNDIIRSRKILIN